MALVQTYIFDQDKFIIIPGIFFLLLFLRMRIINGIVGWDENYVLIKELLKVTRGSIVISTICDYVLMDQGGVYQGTVEHRIMNLVWRYWFNLKIMGKGLFL